MEQSIKRALFSPGGGAPREWSSSSVEVCMQQCVERIFRGEKLTEAGMLAQWNRQRRNLGHE